jgi:hypothetical protein
MVYIIHKLYDWISDLKEISNGITFVAYSPIVGQSDDLGIHMCLIVFFFEKTQKTSPLLERQSFELQSS